MPSGKKYGKPLPKHSETVHSRTPVADATKGRVSGAKKFGKVIAPLQGTSSGHPNCPAHCEGAYVGGMWRHTVGCPHTVVLWYAHGFTVQDWMCPYSCTPTQLSSCLSHHWQCRFWIKEGAEKTPFDYVKGPA